MVAPSLTRTSYTLHGIEVPGAATDPADQGAGQLSGPESNCKPVGLDEAAAERGPPQQPGGAQDGDHQALGDQAGGL